MCNGFTSNIVLFINKADLVLTVDYLLAIGEFVFLWIKVNRYNRTRQNYFYVQGEYQSTL